MALCVAVVTGVTGQDGSYLAEILLDKNYTVYGFARYASEVKLARIKGILDHPRFKLVQGDMTDSMRINTLVQTLAKDESWTRIEIYNLAAQSHVKVSFDQPEFTSNVNSLGPLRWLEAIRLSGDARFRFYQAGTSEMFGKVVETPQTEKTPFWPRSPYGVSKVFAYWITKNYREAYNIHASSGILFNHESPRRGESFVTQKIVMGLHAISQGKQSTLSLGNLDALRDWGHAKDFVNAMWLMLQQDKPDDYVIATGEQHSVREFVEACAPYFGMSIVWEGEGLNEFGINESTGSVIVDDDSRYFRPSEVDSLLGDPTKAKTVLGWSPSYTFESLVEEMCKAEKGELR